MVSHTFWLSPGHPSEPDTWYAGTSPQALWISRDAGESWSAFDQRVAGLDLHFSRRYVELNADYSRNRYDVPSIADPIRGSAAFVELKYTIRPRWFV